MKNVLQRVLSGLHGFRKGFGASGPGWLFNQPALEGTAPSAKLQQPYAQSPWVQQAIRTKASEIVSAPVKFYDGDVEFEDAAFADYWNGKPFIGPGQTGLSLSEVREQSAGWLDLAGERFIILGDDWLVPFPSARATRLSRPMLARPDRLRHVTDGGRLIGWEFRDGSRRSFTLLPEQVLHRKLWNPYDDFRGLAPVEAILLAAESDYLALLYTRNLMRNNGDQGVYIIAKGGLPADGQREQIVADLRAKRAAAQRGDFRPVFLTGDITIEDAKAKAPDAALQQTRLMDRHTVYIGLGLPASMADVQASYSIGSDSDRFRLITGTCMSQARLVDEDLGTIGSLMTGRTLTAEADWDEHPVMQEVRRARVDSMQKLWAMGMPAKDANDYLDMGMKPFAGWDRGYLPFSVVPVDAEDRDPAADPTLSEPEAIDVETETEEERTIRLALLARRRAKARKTLRAEAGPAPVCSCAPSGDLEGPIPEGKDAAQVARWREYMRGRREQMAGFRSRFSRWLLGVRREVLAKLDTLPQGKGAAVQRNAGLDLIFNTASATVEFLDAMKRQHGLALNAAGKEVMRELGREDPFSFAPTEVLQFFATRENRLRDVPEAAFERIRASLQEGLDAGESTAKLAERVRAECNAIDKGRAQVIAQSEVAAAYGTGRDMAMRRAGVKLKAWLTSGNSNVRSAHVRAGEEYSPENPIPIDEPFVVDGEALMYPGDPQGSPGNVINCHCIQIAVVPDIGEDET